jgi:hypothetical protein
MGDAAEALQANLSGGAFHRVNGAEELVDFLGTVIGF